MFFYFPSKTDVHVYYVYLQILQYTYCDLEQTACLQSLTALYIKSVSFFNNV